MSITQAISLVRPGEEVSCKVLMDRAEEKGQSRWGAKNGVWYAVKAGLLEKTGDSRANRKVKLTKDGVEYRRTLICR